MKSLKGKQINQGQKLDAIRVKNVVASKKDILSERGLMEWISNILKTAVKSLEELRTGSIYCQILHRLFPKAIMLKRVRLFTVYEFEFEINFRLLALAFAKLQIKHDVPMQQLMQGPGNYRFCNWFRQFCLANDDGKLYNANEMRQNSLIGLGHKDIRFSWDLTRSQSIIERNSLPVMKKAKPTQKLRRKRVTPRWKRSHPEVYYCDESRNIELPSDTEFDSDDNEGVKSSVIGKVKPRTTCSTNRKDRKEKSKFVLFPDKEDSYRQQEILILRLRQQQRKAAELLDSVKSILLDNANDSNFSLRHIRSIVFNKSLQFDNTI